ncbi:MAG: Hsp20 family protein [Alphaproteobacteria bacterium]|nr:Hsp20 family protein [Alphaproteobacteria bacterium]
MILPDDVNAESIQAKVENGLMHLSLRRVPEAQPRKIHVS